MNNKQHNIEIAKSLGYFKKRLEGQGYHGEYWHNKEQHICHSLPYYTADFNAMHDAIMSLKGDLQQLFEEELETVLYNDRIPGDYIYPSRATAAQQAEAFLETIGKWEESK